MGFFILAANIIQMIQAGLTTTEQVINTVKAGKVRIADNEADPGMTVEELETLFAAARAQGLLTGDNAANRLEERNK